MSKYKFKNHYGGDNEKVAIEYKDAGIVCEALRVHLGKANTYIRKLKDEINSYKNDNNAIKNEKKNITTNLITLEDNLKKKEIEINELKRQINKFQDDIKTFENFDDKSKSTIEEFNNLINESNTQNSLTPESEEENFNEEGDQFGGKRNKKRKSPKKILRNTRRTSKKRNSPKK